MTRELILQNIMNNYGKYGITEDMINEVIDAGIEGGMNYDMIYLDICRRISEITGEEFVCSASDMAKAYGVLLREFIQSNMHTRSSVFYLARAWEEYHFGDTKKANNYMDKFVREGVQMDKEMNG